MALPKHGKDEKALFETLERYRERLPQRVLEQVRKESTTRRALAAGGLPRLSLFHAQE